MDNIKLTQYSHGAGCGCKISPQTLSTILHSELAKGNHPNLMVGNDSRDDAAVYDFKVDMEVQMTKVGNLTVPSLIRYNGNWKAITKKRERGVFTATLFDFE